MGWLGGPGRTPSSPVPLIPVRGPSLALYFTEDDRVAGYSPT